MLGLPRSGWRAWKAPLVLGLWMFLAKPTVCKFLSASRDSKLGVLLRK